MAYALIGSMLLVTTLATAFDGSVRSSAVIAMMATVVLAGTFLPRPGMIAVGLYCTLVLGLFNWLEQRGIFVPGSMRMGWAVWVVHTAVIVTILVSVFFGRYRLMRAYSRLTHSLKQTLETEADLRASEERFRALFRGNPAACLVQSLNNRMVVDVNDAYADMSGYSREEMLGQPPPVLWANPADDRTFRAALKAHGRVRGMRTWGGGAMPVCSKPDVRRGGAKRARTPSLRDGDRRQPGGTGTPGAAEIGRAFLQGVQLQPAGHEHHTDIRWTLHGGQPRQGTCAGLQSGRLRGQDRDRGRDLAQPGRPRGLHPSAAPGWPPAGL
ncbi:PAS domain S-box protein [Hydrogenophaga sp. T4]|nr:PAS domain S-box protein [Hydrogenophaga sp. T4]